MTTTIEPEEIYFGAPASLTYGGVEIGATTAPPKVSIDVTKYEPEFQGARGPIKGVSMIIRVIAAVEVVINEIVAAKLAWAFPGAVSTVGSSSVTGGGGTGTLYADCVAGATNIKVTSVTNIIAGDYLRIGDSGEQEIHKVLVVGTINGGSGIDIEGGLLRDHDAGDAYVEVDGLGTTVITWTPGRVPDAAYQDLVLTGVGLDGRQLIVTLFDAMSAESQSLEFSDSTITGLAAKFTAYYDPDAPTVAPFKIEVGG